MCEKTISHCFLISIITFCLSGCSGFLKSDNERLSEKCNPYSGEVSVAIYNKDYQKLKSVLPTVPEECRVNSSRSYITAYNYYLGLANFETGNKSEALKYFELYIANPDCLTLKSDAEIYRNVILSYQDSAKSKEYINNAQLIITKSNYIGSDSYFSLNSAKYDHGDRSSELLKSYLDNLDAQEKPGMIPNPDNYTIPIKLSQELGKPKIASLLTERQRNFMNIRDKSRSMDIPGFGTASGNIPLLIKRDAFYLTEFSRINMKDQADYYQKDLQKYREMAVLRSEQSAIDIADAANAENEKHKYYQDVFSSLSGLAGQLAVNYTNTKSHTQKQSHQFGGSTGNVGNVNNMAPSTETIYTPAGSGKVLPSSSVNNNEKKKSTYKQYATAMQCITLDTKTSATTDRWANSCNYSVWVKWFDDNICQTGCGTSVSAHARESINKFPKGMSARVAVCVNPGIPYEPKEDKPWQGSGSFRCIF